MLGLPRGGVPVAYEVARALDAQLDVWLARKLGAPGEPELGMGAVAESGETFVDPHIVRYRWNMLRAFSSLAAVTAVPLLVACAGSKPPVKTAAGVTSMQPKTHALETPQQAANSGNIQISDEGPEGLRHRRPPRILRLARRCDRRTCPC